MQTPIKIDLRKLTREHVEQARPNMGKCTYSAPCIIGTLLTEEERKFLDEYSNTSKGLAPCGEGGSYDVGVLASYGVIEFAEADQLEHADTLQGRFDNNSLEAFDEKVDELLARAPAIT